MSDATNRARISLEDLDRIVAVIDAIFPREYERTTDVVHAVLSVYQSLPSSTHPGRTLSERHAYEEGLDGYDRVIDELRDALTERDRYKTALENVITYLSRGSCDAARYTAEAAFK